MPRTLLGIQAARGIAALLVVLYHAERALALPQYIGHPAWAGASGFGHAGVDFFFVLSGFVIFYGNCSPPCSGGLHNSLSGQRGP